MGWLNIVTRQSRPGSVDRETWGRRDLRQGDGAMACWPQWTVQGEGSGWSGPVLFWQVSPSKGT